MRCTGLVVALMTLGGVTGAQEPRQAAEAARMRCDSVLHASVADSERVLVRAWMDRRGGDVLPPQTAGLMLQEFVAHFHPPKPMRLPVFSQGPVQMRSLRVLRAEERALREPRLDGTYRLVLRRDGTATHIETFRPSLVPGLDSAVVAALKAVSHDKLFLYQSDDPSEDSIPVTLRLTSSAEGRGTAVTVFASMFPRVPLTDAEPREPVPTPVYPEAEREAGVEGDVLFQLAVNADGEPELETIEVMHASTRGFALAAYDAVRQMRWTPARVDGCSVPQVVSIPMRFTLPRTRTDSTAKPKPH